MAEMMNELAMQERKTFGAAPSKDIWYKERIKTKFVKQPKPGPCKENFDTKNWLFLKRGLDDFRDGLPPIASSKSKATSKAFPPSLYKDFVKISDIKSPEGLKRLNRYQTYLSKSSPQKQQQRKYLESVEEGLLEHPLALYPHLEESVPPEQRSLLNYYLKFWETNMTTKDISQKVYENILELLDPQFSYPEFPDEDMDLLEMMDDDYPGESLLNVSQPEEGKHKHGQGMSFEPSFRNMYKWQPPKENSKESKKNKEKLWPSSQSEEEHIRQVTRDFCEWVADLGGESNNIEESTLTSLFASGYDTKPALSVPIHVVDLANVPHELRLSAMVPPPLQPEKTTPVAEKHIKKSIGSTEPTFVKFRYGAWYLSPHTWKKMGYYEPLEDPKQLKQHEMSEAKKKCYELTEELSAMHASKAFDEFIMKKNTRKPEFLVDIAEIQRKAALEEEQRVTSEMLMKQKKAIPKATQHVI